MLATMASRARSSLKSRSMYETQLASPTSSVYLTSSSILISHECFVGLFSTVHLRAGPRRLLRILAQMFRSMVTVEDSLRTGAFPSTLSTSPSMLAPRFLLKVEAPQTMVTRPRRRGNSSHTAAKAQTHRPPLRLQLQLLCPPHIISECFMLYCDHLEPLRLSLRSNHISAPTNMPIQQQPAYSFTGPP